MALFSFNILHTLTMEALLVGICISIILTFEKKIITASINPPSLEFIPPPPSDQYERNLLHIKRDFMVWSNRTVDSLRDCTSEYDCKDKISKFGDCTSHNFFGFRKLMPCIFLKLNVDREWIPQYYVYSNELPKDTAKRVLDIIDENANKEQNGILWVTCDGETAADKEFIGPIKIYSNSGAPGFTADQSGKFLLKDSYIAVHFKRPTIGIIINIECRIWAKNIQYDPKNELGAINFKLWQD